ncbi:hypothetical protein D3C81_1532220 [compost metagenome]
MATASADCSGVPPASSTTAPAAIAEAEPTSAWHPPAAPEIKDWFAMTIPIAPEVNRKRTIISRLTPSSGANPNKHPGITPQAPAVGVATIVPIAALTSLVAIARLTAFSILLPEIVLPPAA